MSKTSNNKLSFFLKKIQGTPKDNSAEIEKKHKEVTGDIESAENGKIVINENLYLNTLSKQYVVYLKSLGKNVVIPEDKIKSVVTNYTDLFHDAATIEDVAKQLKMPRKIAEEILKVFGFTHSSLPVTPYELHVSSDEEIVSDIEELRKFRLSQEIEKQAWHTIQGQALKWQKLEKNILDPFEQFVKNIKPIEYKPKFKGNVEKTGKFLCIGLSDIHWGANSEKRYLFGKSAEDWNIDKTNHAVDKYLAGIFQLIKGRNYKFEECIAISLGDILHTLTGETAKGTPIEGFPLGEEQFDQAFTSLVKFFQGLSEMIGLSRVLSITGNHSLSDCHLFKCLKAYFRNYPNLIFNVYDSRWAVEKVGGLGLLIEHGASPYFKTKLPPMGNQRDAYVQKLILQNRGELDGCKQVVYISGDQHHFEYNERANYEQVMFSTVVGNDFYANQHGLFNIPRQNGLVIEDGKIVEVLNFYC